MQSSMCQQYIDCILMSLENLPRGSGMFVSQTLHIDVGLDLVDQVDNLLGRQKGHNHLILTSTFQLDTRCKLLRRLRLLQKIAMRKRTLPSLKSDTCTFCWWVRSSLTIKARWWVRSTWRVSDFKNCFLFHILNSFDLHSTRKPI